MLDTDTVTAVYSMIFFYQYIDKFPFGRVTSGYPEVAGRNIKNALAGTEEDGAMEEAQTTACPAQMSGENERMPR